VSDSLTSSISAIASRNACFKASQEGQTIGIGPDMDVALGQGRNGNPQQKHDCEA
jgi:hypothetical protein